MRRTWIGLVLLLLLAACARNVGDGSPSSSPSSSPSISPERSPISATQLPAGNTITGILGADTIEGGCAYLETEDGTRYQVIYPDGWTLKRSGPELTGPDGAVFAGGGDVITVRGSVDRDMATTCQIGPVFRATEVVEP